MQPHSIHPSPIETRLRAQLADGKACQLNDTPDFPLAFNVPLPAGFCSGSGEPNGHVGIRFEDFSITGLDSVHVDHDRTAAAEGLAGLRAVCVWEQLQITGRYVLAATPAPVITMDTGGTLLDFEDDMLPAGGQDGPASAPLDSTTADAMLDNARAQRTRLMDDPAGQKLMAVYNEHNEVYNTVFASNASARATWAKAGATRDMALHTHAAVKGQGPDVINPPPAQTTFGTSQMGYNENAFVQQLTIAVAATMLDTTFDPFDGDAVPDPNNKFVKAGLAALTFGNAVGQTGNTKSSINPLGTEAVYSAVKGGTEPPEATVTDLTNVISQGVQGGGKAAAEAADKGWRVLDEADRRLVRHHVYSAVKARAEKANLQAEALWSGSCNATLAGVSAGLQFSVSGGRPQFESLTLELPAFELDLDDSGWTGAAAETARERLAEALFLQSLLRDRIETRLKDRLAEAALEACRSAV